MSFDWQDVSTDDVECYLALIPPYQVEAWPSGEPGNWAAQITDDTDGAAPLAESTRLAGGLAVEVWARAQIRRLHSGNVSHPQRQTRGAPRLTQQSFWSQAGATALRWDGAERSYWLRSNEIRCGAYPGDRDPDQAGRQLTELLDLGVTSFVDLTEHGELQPYAVQLLELARSRRVDVQYIRHPIIDISVPTRRELLGILDTIDAARIAGRIVFIHCRGGVGRTGTVAGCWLVRHGMTPAGALRTVATARSEMYNGWKRSPETAQQESMIRDWHAGQ